ncbi:hypothetical protein CY34DRAFT_807253 [Suillus luteus UH-Slu-Lm8-n1]|uniref:Uncharacterized protein n=1 Tax=Suillus luteus UH-Slu-Lm8-n1 TaxID=930992 RepID=A0A0D0B9N8_9AGAM|nr:hypothetical protein CY34DRAFT_807253 [Suillus luteus UH-Slu-Lm8-n1]
MSTRPRLPLQPARLAKNAPSESGGPGHWIQHHVKTSQKSQNQVLNVVPRTRIIHPHRSVYDVPGCPSVMATRARTPAVGFASMRTSDIPYRRSFRNSIDVDRSAEQPFTILLPSEITASAASSANVQAF